MSLLDKTNLLITPNAFKASKLYSVIPSSGTGDLTAVRNTTATRVNSSGFIESIAANVPRLNYVNVGGNPSILVEPQTTNLALYSSDFNNAAFAKDSTVLSNNTTSPANDLTGSKITERTNTGRQGLFQTLGSLAQSNYSFSLFAKESTNRYVVINISDVSGANYFQSVFDLNNGTITQENLNGSAVKISSKSTSLLNGWYRIEIIVNVIPKYLTISLSRVPTFIPGSFGYNNYAGNGTGNIFIWGMQFENRTTTTSYIPTTSAAVTRNEDIITVAPPVGTVKITTTFSDNTTQVLITIPATFTVPEGLIKQVLMQSSL
mgnify:CR=1 FL=1